MDDGLPPTAHVGRVALRVGALDSLVEFYTRTVGLSILDRSDTRVTLGAGDEPLLELESAPDAAARDPAESGLFHLAFRVPGRTSLGDALARLRDGWQLTGASDHGVSEALYTSDPEGNGVELYRDRERDQWPRDGDRVAMYTEPLDVDSLAAEAASNDALPPGTDVGHVHLEPMDLDAARGFYVDDLGMNVRQAWGDEALFLAAGKYHHHVGLNVWHGRSEPAGEGLGLAWWELLVPDGDALEAAAARLDTRGASRRAGSVRVTDPSGFELRIAVER